MLMYFGQKEERAMATVIVFADKFTPMVAMIQTTAAMKTAPRFSQ